MEYPRAQALCLEDLDARSEARRFLCCVAVPGRQPGLGLDRQGAPRWRAEGPLACELWVTGDRCLALYRREGAPEVVVSRLGRELAVPTEKPVILRHEDVVHVGARRLRVHLHGETDQVAEPSFYPVEEGGLGGRVRAAAAALAIGAAALSGAAGCKDDASASGKKPAPRIEVRTRPPDVSPPQRPRPKPKPDAGVMKADPPDMDIEVRTRPPEPPPPPPDAGTRKPPMK